MQKLSARPLPPNNYRWQNMKILRIWPTRPYMQTTKNTVNIWPLSPNMQMYSKYRCFRDLGYHTPTHHSTPRCNGMQQRIEKTLLLPVCGSGKKIVCCTLTKYIRTVYFPDSLKINQCLSFFNTRICVKNKDLFSNSWNLIHCFYIIHIFQPVPISQFN